MLLVIDNYDSFTYNIVQYLGELGQQLEVHRNDQISIDQIEAMAPEKILVGPGPCTPAEAGISKAVIEHFAPRLPILGVCLGHQAIGEVFGGKVVRAERIMHGKLSPVRHNGQGVFEGLPSPFEATRYHSLVVEHSSLPDCLEVTAWVENSGGGIEAIMGLRHKTLPVEGVQYHPESIRSAHGHTQLQRFLDQ
ncbi:MAG: anthranilate synthase component II [Granulosicoccaceae bacterium]